MRVNIFRGLFLMAAIGGLLSQLSSYTTVVGKIPEPAAMILFGTGVIAASLLR